MRRHARQLQTAHKPGSAPDPLSLLREYDIDTNPSRPVRSSPLAASTIQGLPLELIDRLRSFPLFESAPDSFLAAIGKSLRPQLYQPHDSILSEGDDARAMYWLVRGSVRVTSRDGESTYAELKPGAFFGEIGILMEMPRTATITASARSLVVRLNKEDLQKELPNYPQVERAIRDEAVERLAILERKKKQNAAGATSGNTFHRKRSRDYMSAVIGQDQETELVKEDDYAIKKRKSPSPGLSDGVATSALAQSAMTVRQILKELPLFSGLPADILHFLGINAQQSTFAPFTDILKQGSHGREIYFVVSGEVEVVADTPSPDAMQIDTPSVSPSLRPVQRVKARIRAGQYFGEVTSLSLAPKRTATVRSINQVECLRITGDILDELWRKCPPHIRQQVETEAKRRMDSGDDYYMTTPSRSRSPSQESHTKRRITPTVTFGDVGFELPSASDPVPALEPLDPDPFFNADLHNVRTKSRRSSLAPPSPDTGSTTPIEGSRLHPGSPSSRRTSSSPSRLKSSLSSLSSSPESTMHPGPRTTLRRHPSEHGRGILPDSILVLVFQYLDIVDLLRLRRASAHWQKLISTSPDVLHDLDLSSYNRKITDSVLVGCIAPFAGSRPRRINLNNCFHITDEGFTALATASAVNARCWKMRSVWDVGAPSILDLVSKAPHLEDIDLSNCRKVGDALLARIIGWVTPQQPPGIQASAATNMPAGSKSLKRLTLSYCKHVQDRSMAHIAQHASNRLESIDLTRCTSVTDQGFQHWAMHSFPELKKLVLADCTYLSDQAIVGVANAARNLRELDLSFCCALSDTATEVLSLGLTQLTSLDLAFCGSAVSDSSLRCIGMHLLELRFLSVRGCVRVTGQGVEGVVDGCASLEVFDVSQCKNLLPWLEAGGVQAVRERGCGVRFEIVASGNWRGGAKGL